MNYLELLAMLKERQWRTAYETYHNYVVGGRVPGHVEDQYRRAFQDYTLAKRMAQRTMQMS